MKWAVFGQPIFLLYSCVNISCIVFCFKGRCHPQVTVGWSLHKVKDVIYLLLGSLIKTTKGQAPVSPFKGRCRPQVTERWSLHKVKDVIYLLLDGLITTVIFVACSYLLPPTHAVVAFPFVLTKGNKSKLRVS